MTSYQLYTGLIHLLTARHWRGHGIHSPAMYAFVREVVMQIPRLRRKLPEAMRTKYGAENVAVVESVEELRGAHAKLHFQHQQESSPSQQQSKLDDAQFQPPQGIDFFKPTEGQPMALLLKKPFRSRMERQAFKAWYEQPEIQAVAAHFPGWMVLFFDWKCPKQRYNIRN